MFLNQLNAQEKTAFLELAHYVARCDGIFREEEQAVISTYCTEMGINNINFAESEFNLEVTLAKFQIPTSQKIVLLEIMALIYADNRFHSEEQKVVSTMLEKFGISQNTSIVYAEWSKAMMSMCVQGEALIRL